MEEGESDNEFMNRKSYAVSMIIIRSRTEAELIIKTNVTIILLYPVIKLSE